MKKAVVLLLLVSLCAGILAGCGQQKPSPAMQIADTYIDGFRKFYELGNEYTQQGLQIQARYAYGWAAASVSSMRRCVDCLLTAKGGKPVSDSSSDELPPDWDTIAAMNYASPYPWFFQGLADQAEGRTNEAEACYENALVNPAFDSEYGKALFVLGAMPAGELKTLQKKLTGLEDQIFAVYTPEPADIPWDARSFDDVYLCLRARETLQADETNYRGALRYYQAAVAVNPFDGDNFAGCALMCLYLNDSDRTFYYVNEGLYVDPNHEGLNRLAGLLNQEEAQ